jgi:hypothetical protein
MVHRSLWLGMMAAVTLTLGAVVSTNLYSTAVLGSGFLAQLLCSSTFVSHRDPQTVVAEDMSGPGYELVSFFQWQVERDRKRATASMFGLGNRTAIFREGLGCTLVVNSPEDELRAQAGGAVSPAPVSNRDAPCLKVSESMSRHHPRRSIARRLMRRFKLPSPSPIPTIRATPAPLSSSTETVLSPSAMRQVLMPRCP